jgi:hypothetical protein
MISTGVVQIEDNRSYTIAADHLSIADFTLQAANQRRPYLEIQSDFVLSSGPGTNARLLLDGLWIAAKGNGKFKIIIRGAFECVTIRHCTFDPGGDKNALGETLFSCRARGGGINRDSLYRIKYSGTGIDNSAGINRRQSHCQR